VRKANQTKSRTHSRLLLPSKHVLYHDIKEVNLLQDGSNCVIFYVNSSVAICRTRSLHEICAILIHKQNSDKNADSAKYHVLKKNQLTLDY
jgi:hypothetical protein